MVSVGKRMWNPMFRPNCARASRRASSMGDNSLMASAVATPADSATLTRGKLKIFFGAFPGAGKTDAMLAAARRMREAGRDVVIGVIDMHGKPGEAAATAGFEGVGSAPHG